MANQKHPRTVKSEVVESKTRKSKGYRWHDLYVEIFFGALALVAITTSKIFWDESALGHRFEAFVETELQRRLSGNEETNEPSAVIVDIKNIRVEPVPGQIEQVATDPEKLFPLIEEIVAARPMAVAVDIDFGPKVNGQLKHPKHHEFFQHCLDLTAKSNIPIYLGVYDSQNETRDHWLGGAEFADMAAGMVIPNSSYRVQLWRDAGHGRLESISQKLAHALHADEPPHAGWWSWAFEVELVGGFKSFDDKPVTVGQIVYDSGPLNRLIRGTVEAPAMPQHPASEPVLFSNSVARKFLGKVVLLGDGQYSAVDKYPLPGIDLVSNDLDSNPGAVPGIYIHACGALTPSRGYLWTLTHWGRLAVDLVLGLSALVIIWLLQTSILIANPGRRLNEKFIGNILTVMSLFLVWSVAYVFLKQQRLIWVDFPVVVLAVVFHRSVHHWLEPMVPKLWSWLKANFTEDDIKHH